MVESDRKKCTLTPIKCGKSVDNSTQRWENEYAFSRAQNAVNGMAQRLFKNLRRKYK